MASIFVDSAAAGADDGTSWADAYETVALAIANGGAGITNADTIYVSNTHDEAGLTGDTNWTFPTSPGCRLLCVTPSGATGNSGLATTGIIKTTTNGIDLFINGFVYIYGLVFNFGAVGSQHLLALGNANNVSHGIVAEACEFNFPSTSGVSTLILGPSGTNVAIRAQVDVNDCIFSHESTQGGQHAIQCRNGQVYVRGLRTTASGDAANYIGMLATGSVQGRAIFDGCDFSNITPTTAFINVPINSAYLLLFRDCKLPSGTLIAGTYSGASGIVIDLQNCDSDDTHIRLERHSFEGNTVTDGDIYLNAQQTDGSQFSFKMTGDNASLLYPIQSPEIALWNSTVGSQQTATIEIIRDNATNLQDDEIWVELMYLGTSGAPLGSIVSDRVATILTTAADQDDSAASWTGVAGFTNANTQKLVVNFTAQEVGYIIARVYLAANTTVYVDPVITLS